MSFQRGYAREAGSLDDDVEMPAFTCPGMAGMLGTVVANLQQTGLQRGFERGTKAIGARVQEVSFANTPRSR
jgi:hypothetical protein